jgi:hypothetical protein
MKCARLPSHAHTSPGCVWLSKLVGAWSQSTHGAIPLRGDLVARTPRPGSPCRRGRSWTRRTPSPDPRLAPSRVGDQAALPHLPTPEEELLRSITSCHVREIVFGHEAHLHQVPWRRTLRRGHARRGSRRREDCCSRIQATLSERQTKPRRNRVAQPAALPQAFRLPSLFPRPVNLMSAAPRQTRY